MKNWEKFNAALVGLLLLVLFAIVLYPAWITESYQIKEGTVATEKIVLQQRVKDVQATNQAKNRASSQVETVYDQVDLNPEGLLNKLIAEVVIINGNQKLTQDTKVKRYQDLINYTYFMDYFDKKIAESREQQSDLYSDAFVTDIRDSIRRNAYLTEDSKKTFKASFDLPTLEPAQVERVQSFVAEMLVKLYQNEYLEIASVRDTFSELALSFESSSATERTVALELLRYVSVPNLFLNESASRQKRLEARESVGEVWLEKGTVMVQVGELIDAKKMKRLIEFGIVDDQFRLGPHLGLWMFSLILVLLMYAILKQNIQFDRNYSTIVMLLSIVVLVILLMRLTFELQEFTSYQIAFLMPLAVASVLVALLFDVRTAYVFAFVFSVLAGSVFHAETASIFDYRHGFFAFAVSITAIYTSEQVTERRAMLRTGLMIGAVGSVTLISFALVERSQSGFLWFLEPITYSFVNGALTSVLILGLLPIFETLFGKLSNMKLIELEKQNHPLLQDLVNKAPGTYNHSMAVANLAAAAAEEIGANSLLCRVCAYYHDVGKLERPNFFAENMTSDKNPHDSLDPFISRTMLISHVSDGLVKLKEHKFPPTIIGIIASHHGTTLIRYFYSKALKQAEEKIVEGQKSLIDVDLDSFRYPGPKPQSMEGLILMIADSVEAMMRSLKLSDHKLIDQKVDEIIREKLDDKQFDMCHVTLSQLNAIGEVMKRVLHGNVHDRPAYPSLPAKEEKPQDDPIELGE